MGQSDIRTEMIWGTLHIDFFYRDGRTRVTIPFDFHASSSQNSARFAMDGPTKTIGKWSELWENFGEEELRELASFIEWLQSKDYFLDAVVKLQNEIDERPPVHSHADI
jgi:hypothetical protein